MAEEKKQGPIGKFFAEFKKFITRGNVLDMSVGVIVGGAFTSIVNGLSNFILKPLVNWLLALLIGGDTLNHLITPLCDPVYILDEAGKSTGVFDLTQMPHYIDWGSFINAIINFLLIAFVLFMIVKTINSLNDASKKALGELASNEKKEIRRIKRERKVSWKEAKAIYQAEQEALAAAKAEEERIAAETAAAAAAEEARIAEEKAAVNTRLLEEIRDLLKKQS